MEVRIPRAPVTSPSVSLDRTFHGPGRGSTRYAIPTTWQKFLQSRPCISLFAEGLARSRRIPITWHASLVPLLALLHWDRSPICARTETVLLSADHRPGSAGGSDNQSIVLPHTPIHPSQSHSEQLKQVAAHGFASFRAGARCTLSASSFPLGIARLIVANSLQKKVCLCGLTRSGSLS